MSRAAGTSSRAPCSPMPPTTGTTPRQPLAGDRRGGRGRTGARARRTGGVDALQPRGKRTCRAATGMPQSRRASTPSPSGRRATSTGSLFARGSRCARSPSRAARSSSSSRRIRASRRDKGWSPIRSTRGSSSTAIHLAFADAGLEPAFVPDVELRLPCFDMDHGGPSWLAAVDAVVGCWLEAGELDGVEEALSRMRVSLERSPPTNLAVVTEAVLLPPSSSPVAELLPTRSRQPSRRASSTLRGGARRLLAWSASLRVTRMRWAKPSGSSRLWACPPTPGRGHKLSPMSAIAADAPIAQPFEIVPVKALPMSARPRGSGRGHRPDSRWALDFFHVAGGGIWTAVDLFVGFVLGPILGRMSIPGTVELTEEADAEARADHSRARHDDARGRLPARAAQRDARHVVLAPCVGRRLLPRS